MKREANRVFLTFNVFGGKALLDKAYIYVKKGSKYHLE
jgi:hypothetical protein